MSLEIVLSLENFSTEILLTIFSYLPKRDLISLKNVCTRFYKIVNHHWDVILFNRRELYLVTNQCSDYIQKRSRKLLAPFEKHRISNNWKVGRYKESSIYLSRAFITQFYLEKNSIWIGKGGCIKCCQRVGNTINMHRAKYKLHGYNHTEVCKFVVRNNYVTTVNRDCLRLFSLQKRGYTSVINFKEMSMSSVDMESNVVVIGSKDGAVQLFKISQDSDLIPSEKIEYDDRIWSLALNEGTLAAGTAANKSRICIFVKDIESGQSLHKFYANKYGAGILHLKWQSPFVLWSGGYDYCLKRWDLRLGQCVQTFLDPCASKINCFDYDLINTVITGCNDSRATLWDVRKDKYVQIYYMESASRSRRRSPIQSIAFDAEHLFAATDLHMNILDFSVIKGGIQDYSEIFSTQLVI